MATIMTAKARISIYGLVICVAWLVFLFIASLVTGTDANTKINTWPFIVDNIVTAVFLAITSFWFINRLNFDNRRDAWLAGIIWAVMLIIIQLIITIPNKTMNVVFGSWSAYFSYIGILAGTMIKLPYGTSGSDYEADN